MLTLFPSIDFYPKFYNQYDFFTEKKKIILKWTFYLANNSE